MRGDPSRGGDPSCRLDPVEVRHPDVHEDDVGAQCLGGVDRGEAVGGFADDLEVGLGVEDDAEAGADELLVVGDQDADHVVVSERKPRADGVAAAVARAGLERAAVERDPLAHADQAVPGAVARSCARPRPSSTTSSSSARVR